MGVHWDNNGKYIYFASTIKQETDIINAYKKITEAVESEYGKILKTNQNTVYEGICEDVKNKIF